MASGPTANPRRGTWYIQWHDGKQWRRTTVARKRPGWKVGDPMPKRPPADAQAQLAGFIAKEKAARQIRTIDPDQTVAAFLEEYKASYVNRAKGTQKELAHVVATFLGWCSAAKIIRLDQVTKAVCQRWLRSRATTTYTTKSGGGEGTAGRTISHSTLVKERALLMGAWAEAVATDEIDRNPWEDTTIPGKPKAKERKAWSPEQVDQLLKASKPWLRTIIIFGCNTGLRISAMLKFEWIDIKWAKPDQKGFGFVVVRPELDKAGKGYRVPISKTLHDMLSVRLVHKEADATHVLTGHLGKRIVSGNVTATAIIRACRRAGLEIPSSPNHHMRRTFGRWAVLGHLTGRPIPLWVVSKWMGHATVKMTERYLDMTADDSAEWMEEYTPDKTGD